MKKHVKITIALVGGFAIAMLAMTIAIFIGYTQAYNTGIETSIVRLVGIPIYTLTKSGGKYVGESQGVYMGLVCGICMLIGVATEEIITLYGAIGGILASLLYILQNNRMMTYVESRVYRSAHDDK